jgi:hypothetical protein
VSSGSFTHDPQHWRDRAAEARSLAEKMNDDISKEMMYRIAEDYERLAARAELRLLDHRKKEG